MKNKHLREKKRVWESERQKGYNGDFRKKNEKKIFLNVYILDLLIGPVNEK